MHTMTDPAEALPRLLKAERLSVYPSGPARQETAKRPFRRLLSAACLALAIGISATSAYAAPSLNVLQAVKSVTTAESQRLQALHDRFGAGDQAPVVYIDADAADIEMSLGASEYKNISLAETLVRQVRDQTGDTLEPAAAQVLANKLAGTGEAGSFYFSKGDGLRADSPDQAVCVVLPSSAEDSLGILAGSIAGITPEALKLPAGVSPAAALAALRDFTELHETSHCLDTRYMPRARAGDPDGSLRHKGEMFADVHAALLMARDGGPQIGRLMLDLRNIAVATRHSVDAKKTIAAHNNPAGTMVYAIGPGLAAANAYIADHGAEIRGMDDAALKKTAYSIVENHALSADARALLGLRMAGLTVENVPGADPYDMQVAATAQAAIDLSIAARVDTSRLGGPEPTEPSRFQPTAPHVAKKAGALAAKGDMAGAAQVITRDRDQRRIEIAATPIRSRP